MNTTGNIVQEGFPVSFDIIEQDHKFFPHPWKLDQWESLNPEQNLVFSWNVETKLMAWALFGHLPGDDTVHLHKILVHPDHRGLGHVQRFWEAILARLRKTSATQVYLEVEASNQIAQKFYLKCEFQLIRRAKGYYSNGEDALIMLLTL